MRGKLIRKIKMKNEKRTENFLQRVCVIKKIQYSYVIYNEALFYGFMTPYIILRKN